MDLILVNAPITNLVQLETIIPALKGKIVLVLPNTARIADSVTLSPAEIATVQNFQFDPCVAFDGYDPVKFNEFVKARDVMHGYIQPLVGAAPPDMFTHEYVYKRGGLNPTTGFILPIATWDPEPQVITDFKASPCYTP